MPPSTQRRQVSVRRAPKFMPFIFGAVILAFTAAILVVYSTPQDPNYTRIASIGYITLVLCFPALALAAAAWLAVERFFRKRSTTHEIEPAGER